MLHEAMGLFTRASLSPAHFSFLNQANSWMTERLKATAAEAIRFSQAGSKLKRAAAAGLSAFVLTVTLRTEMLWHVVIGSWSHNR